MSGHYKVTVYTGDEYLGGTDGTVKITLIGPGGQTGPHELDSSGNDFERDSSYQYDVRGEDVGIPDQIQVSHSGDGWFLAKMEVLYNRQSHTYHYNNWLEDAAATLRRLHPDDDKKALYMFTVKTTDKTHAGTDGDIFIRLHGPQGAGITAFTEIDTPGYDDFERGREDTYVNQMLDVGLPEQIDVSHDGSEGWNVDWIRVSYPVTGDPNNRHSADTRDITFNFGGAYLKNSMRTAGQAPSTQISPLGTGIKPAAEVTATVDNRLADTPATLNDSSTVTVHRSLNYTHTEASGKSTTIDVGIEKKVKKLFKFSMNVSQQFHSEVTRAVQVGQEESVQHTVTLTGDVAPRSLHAVKRKVYEKVITGTVIRGAESLNFAYDTGDIETAQEHEVERFTMSPGDDNWPHGDSEWKALFDNPDKPIYYLYNGVEISVRASGLRLRTSPEYLQNLSNVLRQLPHGTRGTITGDPVFDGQGYKWWPVEGTDLQGNKVSGWVAEADASLPPADRDWQILPAKLFE